jgi:hypothetical protein
VTVPPSPPEHRSPPDVIELTGEKLAVARQSMADAEAQLIAALGLVITQPRADKVAMGEPLRIALENLRRARTVLDGG